VRQLRGATKEELLRFYKEDTFTVQLFVGQSPASEDVNTEAEEATALEAVKVKTQQTQKT
jgi:hypothetical protein